jgi:AcrR family transcriptional regulator
LPHTDIETDGHETKTRRQSNNTRALIIDAACDVLGESGYAGLTASALVKQSGISKGGIYHHFDNMDEIILAAYLKTTSEVFSVLGKHTPKSFDDYLGHVEKLLFDSLLAQPKTLRIMHELLPRAMYDPAFGEKRQALEDKGLERMIQVHLGSFAGKATEAELRITFQSIRIFITGLSIHFQMTGNLQACKEMWASFRKMMTEKIDKF